MRSRTTGSTYGSSTSRIPSAASSSRPEVNAPHGWWRSFVRLLLALDTSTDWASVALFDGRDVLAEETWRAQRRHGDELFPAIDRVLVSTRTAMSSVTRVAVATGPGSFTGLRVATLEEICRQIGTHTLFVGEIDAEAKSTLPGLLGPKALFAPPASRMRRA